MTESTFAQDTEYMPVLFRVHRAPKTHGADVTAIFPCEPADYDGRSMMCYAHVGQHGGCDLGWYYLTRPATEAEYASLKHEARKRAVRLSAEGLSAHDAGSSGRVQRRGAPRSTARARRSPRAVPGFLLALRPDRLSTPCLNRSPP